jgi:hypothetical protein
MQTAHPGTAGRSKTAVDDLGRRRRVITRRAGTLFGRVLPREPFSHSDERAEDVPIAMNCITIAMNCIT